MKVIDVRSTHAAMVVVEINSSDGGLINEIRAAFHGALLQNATIAR